MKNVFLFDSKENFEACFNFEILTNIKTQRGINLVNLDTKINSKEIIDKLLELKNNIYFFIHVFSETKEWESNFDDKKEEIKVIIKSHFKNVDLESLNFLAYSKQPTLVSEKGIRCYNKGELLRESTFKILKEISVYDNKIITNEIKIFISHSSKNNVIVQAFKTHILKDALDLNEDSIFMANGSNYTIGIGEETVNRIKNELKESIIFINFLSKSYCKSPICNCELGASLININDNLRISFTLPYFKKEDLPFLDNITRKGELDTKQSILSAFQDNQNIKNILEENGKKVSGTTFDSSLDAFITFIGKHENLEDFE